MQDKHTLNDNLDEVYGEDFPHVYEMLYKLAKRQRQNWGGNYTLNTTALVHEAYIKLAGQSYTQWQNRAHFFSVASRAMRHILMNYARSQSAQRRGGNVGKVSLEGGDFNVNEFFDLTDEQSDLLLRLEEALNKLAQLNERQSKIVECRFFGGMRNKDIADALQISEATVKRGWVMAQAWLFQEMNA